jgi:hypothetical protein
MTGLLLDRLYAASLQTRLDYSKRHRPKKRGPQNAGLTSITT